MKEKNNKSLIGVHPTETLAKLYESQNYLLKSLAIYMYLINEDNDSSLIINMNNVFNKVIKEDYSYSPLTKKIFSSKELVNFKILSNETHNKLVADYEDIFTHEAFPDEIEIDNKEQIPSKKIFGSDLKKIEEEKKEIKDKKKELGWEKYSVADFLEILLNVIDKDKTIDEIKIKDILNIFKKL